MLSSISAGYLLAFTARFSSSLSISLRGIPQFNRLGLVLDKVKSTGSVAIPAFAFRGSTHEFSAGGADKLTEVRQRQNASEDAAKTRIGTKRPPKSKQSLLSQTSDHNRPATATMAGTANGTATDAGVNPETDDSIIWIDCEMTGLDIDNDLIMEVACIITNANLDEVGRLPSIIIRIPEEKLQTMNAWCLSHHGGSGLTEACKKSQVTTADAEKTILAFVQKHTRPGKCPVGGNSVCYDRLFLQKYMPTLYSHFHYRTIDVSTIKELARRWYPKEYNLAGSKKRWTHRTMEDIEDSINELRSYKANLFKQP